MAPPLAGVRGVRTRGGADDRRRPRGGVAGRRGCMPRARGHRRHSCSARPRVLTRVRHGRAGILERVPAVSTAVGVRGKLGAQEWLPYMGAQVLAAIAAALVARVVSGSGHRTDRGTLGWCRGGLRVPIRAAGREARGRYPGRPCRGRSAIERDAAPLIVELRLHRSQLGGESVWLLYDWSPSAAWRWVSARDTKPLVMAAVMTESRDRPPSIRKGDGLDCPPHPQPDRVKRVRVDAVHERIRLSGEGVELLVERTEGWPAGQYVENRDAIEPRSGRARGAAGSRRRFSRRDIGQQLYISLNTVKTHTRELYRKLGVSSQADAVARAEALGLLEPSQSPG